MLPHVQFAGRCVYFLQRRRIIHRFHDGTLLKVVKRILVFSMAIPVEQIPNNFLHGGNHIMLLMSFMLSFDLGGIAEYGGAKILLHGQIFTILSVCSILHFSGLIKPPNDFHLTKSTMNIELSFLAFSSCWWVLVGCSFVAYVLVSCSNLWEYDLFVSIKPFTTFNWI